MTNTIGIDLGTTKSVVTIWRDGAPRVICDAQGRNITPSVVALDTDSHQLVAGYRALEIFANHPDLAISSIKRFMGRRFSEDVVQQTLHQRSQTRILYEVAESDRRRDGIEVVLGDLHLSPQQVSARILQQLKAQAEAYLQGQPGEGQRVEVSKAVITVPAYFHDSQRQATRDAGQIAGLEVQRVLNEPTAACLAYGYDKLSEPRRKVAVYDLGGGTFDISILEMGAGKPFRVWATNGDTHLGGDDLDWLIVDWALMKLSPNTANRLREDIVALAHLRIAAKQVKAELSAQEEARLQVLGPLSATAGVNDLDLKLTQLELNTIAGPFIERTLEPCRQALQDAGLEGASIEEVLLVGGQTRMPAIRAAVKQFFKRDPNTNLHPEEVVGLGAAVQGAILAGEATGIKLADVVPLSLGVKTGEQMDVLIKRNTPVPFRMSQPRIYSTIKDNQESVEIQIYQGERPLADYNTRLGAFTLHGILPGPAGEPEIAVLFNVDQDCILHVTGEDLRTGAKKDLTITDSVRLSDEDIEAMVHDAERYANEDAARLRMIEQQQQAQRLQDSLATLRTTKGPTLSVDLVAAIDEALAAPPPDDWTPYIELLKRLIAQADNKAL